MIEYEVSFLFSPLSSLSCNRNTVVSDLFNHLLFTVVLSLVSFNSQCLRWTPDDLDSLPGMHMLSQPSVQG